MEFRKLFESIKLVEKFSNEKELNSKNDFQDLLDVLMETIQDIECCLNDAVDANLTRRIKLCLLQLRYTINKISEIIYDECYQRKSCILKMLNKKIYLCLKEVSNILSNNNSEKQSSTDIKYHSLMSQILTELTLSKNVNDISGMIDDLLCTCITIAKLSTPQDFMEISTSCKNVLTASSTFIDADSEDLDDTYIIYHIKCLERKVNTAMLRLFLHVMSYPQQELKSLVKKCGSSCLEVKYSEDLDDEISEFDLVCDRIALVGNFALTSTEDQTIKLKVQNCLANLEYYEECLVPACIDYYLDCNNKDKREIFKYLCTEWKCQVSLLINLLDSVVDPAAFSLVVFEDLSEMLQRIKTKKEDISQSFIENFYKKCLKLLENINKSPDCTLDDSYLNDLRKSLISELKINERKTLHKEKFDHLEVILSLVDQISEHLNKILNKSMSSNEGTDFTNSTLKDLSLNDSVGIYPDIQLQIHSEAVSKEWNECHKENKGTFRPILPNHFLENANKNSPFVFTLYQKTPLRKKIKDNITVSLEISKILGESFDA